MMPKLVTGLMMLFAGLVIIGAAGAGNSPRSTGATAVTPCFSS